MREFRNKFSKEEIIKRVEGYDIPWEFAYDIMTIPDLEAHSRSLSQKPVESEFHMYWENPLMELSHRILRSGNVGCLMRLMPKYDCRLARNVLDMKE